MSTLPQDLSLGEHVQKPIVIPRELRNSSQFTWTEMILRGSWLQARGGVLSPAKSRGRFLSVYQAVLPVCQWCGWLWLMVEEQIHSALMYTPQSTGGFVLILNFERREKQQGAGSALLQVWPPTSVVFRPGSEKANTGAVVIIIIRRDKHGGVSLTLTSQRTSGSANQLAPVNFACLTCSRLFFSFIKHCGKLIHLLTRQFIKDMEPAKGFWITVPLSVFPHSSAAYHLSCKRPNGCYKWRQGIDKG